jgi:16S rRNA (cytidine1402-2'-O)-methyltransferase
MATLFVVATPIGNLGDITSRALDIIRTVDLIACEDTRHTIKLLNHFGIQRPLVSYHDFNERKKADELADRIQAGLRVALVSDAGTPAISDPGYRLVRACRERGLEVIAVPGPSAAVAALSASGLPSDEFLFVGFLPAKATARIEKLEYMREIPATSVFYEAPHRIREMLADVLRVFGDREVCVFRELTKIHEEAVFGRLSEVRDRVKPIGEFTIVVAGSDQAAPPAAPLNLEGLSRKEILAVLADRTGISKKKLYDLLLKD